MKKSAKSHLPIPMAPLSSTTPYQLHFEEEEGQWAAKEWQKDTMGCKDDKEEAAL